VDAADPHAKDPLALDVHCHILPAFDEGSRSPAESLLMARELASLGVRRVHATPHQFRFGNERARPEIEAGVDALRHELERAGVDLELVASAEYLYGERLFRAVETGEALISWATPGGGDERHVLIELPLRDPVVGVESLGRRLLRAGLRPVMAHPERVRSVMADAARTTAWGAAGWEFQLDLLSLSGTYGRDVRATAERLVEAGLYAFVGSDLHRSVQLPDLVRAHERLRRDGLPARTVPLADAPDPVPPARRSR
jgi:protein-tyrosine phosphatase